MNVAKVSLRDKLAQIADHWNPRIVGDVNDCAVKLVKFRGEFVWHHHENEDEMFLVVRGRFRMRLRDGDLEVGEGEMVIVPRGVEHMPVADEEVSVLLVEPRSTLNTGNLVTERTVAQPERL